MAKLYYSEKYGCYGVFRPWRTNPKTQQKMWAKNYGLRAWFIPVDDLENETEG